MRIKKILIISMVFVGILFLTNHFQKVKNGFSVGLDFKQGILPRVSCFVNSGDSLHAAISNSGCTDISVNSGNYVSEGWFNVTQSNKKIRCNGECFTQMFIFEGDNNLLSGFTIQDPDQKTCVRTYGDNNQIIGNDCSQTAEDCFWLWGRGTLLDGNYCHDIWVGTRDSLDQEEFDQHVDCIMSFDWDWPIENMVINGNICDMDRGHGSNQFMIFTHSGNSLETFDGLTISNNVLLGVDSGYQPIAIYDGSTIENVEIVNNTFYNSTGLGASAIYAPETKSNYLFANNAVIGFNTLVNGSGTYVQKNNIVLPLSSYSGLEDPDLYYVYRGNDGRFKLYGFNPMSDSPLVDTGVSGIVSYDFDNNPRDVLVDVGAFEFQKEIVPDVTGTPTDIILFAGETWQANYGLIELPFYQVDGYILQDDVSIYPKDGGRVEYDFTVAQSGYYYLVANVYAKDAGSNSFFYNFDSEPKSSMIWDLNINGGFSEQYGKWRGDDDIEYRSFYMTQGNHTLIIRGREADTKMLSVRVEMIEPIPPTVEPTGTSTPPSIADWICPTVTNDTIFCYKPNP